MGRPELAADLRFATHAARGEHQAELDALIETWTSGFTSAALLHLLHSNGVPAGKIYRAPDMLVDEHFQARQALVKVPHPAFDNLWMANVFPKLSATPGEVQWPGPALGAHNEEIFGGVLGYGRTELAELAAEGVI
jgi:crotonobetainyl-CoA:carnitine CoA-transferase CaiB-like acyl-CoA transferase